MIRLYGIPIQIHPLLWIVLAGSVLTGFILEMLVLFGVVIIHELGHVAAASSFRWRVKAIRLLPFGGVAEVEENGNMPAWQELLVVLAGPAQNLLMVLVAMLCRSIGWWSVGWSEYFIEVNLLIGLFNLLPILPLDGGKLLQTILSIWMPYYQTLHATFTVSLLLGSMMIAVSLGIWNAQGIDLNLLLIGMFLVASNWSDYRNLSYIFIRFLMSREIRKTKRHRQGVTTTPIIVSAQATVQQVVKLLKREQHHVIYICNEQGKITQALPEQRVIATYLSGNEQQVRAKRRYIRYNKRKLSERRI